MGTLTTLTMRAGASMSIRLAPMALFFVLVSLTSLAADDSSVVVRQTFAPADFARFAPRTALDMAQ